MLEPQSVQKPDESNEQKDGHQPEEVYEQEKLIQNADKLIPEKVEVEVDEPTGGNSAQISQVEHSKPEFDT